MQWKAFCFGQLMASTVTAANLINEVLMRIYSTNMAGISMIFLYSLLLLVFAPIHIFKRQKASKLQDDCMKSVEDAEKQKQSEPDKKARYPWLWFTLSAFLDFEANFLAILSFSYLNVILVISLYCLTTPIVMILSFFILHTRFRWNHYVGSCLAIGGILFLFLVKSALHEENPGNVVIGSIIGASAAILFAISNVLQEYISVQFDSIEYLASLGAAGVCFALIQTALSDCFMATGNFSASQFTLPTTLLVLAFALAMLIFYSLTPLFLSKHSAVILNLSLISSAVVTLIISLGVFSFSIDWKFILSFSLIIIGLVLYNIQESKK